MTEYERKLELFANTALASILTNNDVIAVILEQKIHEGKTQANAIVEECVFVAKAMIAELDKHKENG